MEETNLYDLTEQECSELAIALRQNSEAKWMSGMQLCSAGDYSTGIYLLIVSNEELLKSVILSFDGVGFRFRKLNGINKVFNNNELRYLIFFIMSILNLFKVELFTFLKKIKQEKTKFLTLADEFNNSPDKRNQWAKSYGIKKLIQLRNEFRWFNKTRLIRNKNLYLDFHQPGSIKISKPEFTETFNRLNNVRDAFKWLSEVLVAKDPEVLKQMQKMKSGLENGHYEKIDKFLLQLDHNSSPFDTFKSFF